MTDIQAITVPGNRKHECLYMIQHMEEHTFLPYLIVQVSRPFTYFVLHNKLTLKVLVMTIDAQWEGMGDVGSARYEPALLPPCPTIRVLSYSN